MRTTGNLSTIHAATVLSDSPIAPAVRAFKTSESPTQDTNGGDFWSRLTTIELESRRSRQGAAEEIGVPKRLAVTSRIDESDNDAKALLTATVMRLAPALHAIIASKALRAGLPIERAYFEVDRDDEEGSRQLVLVVQVHANAPQALAFWNSLDFELDRWILPLNQADRETVTNRLGVRFVWDDLFRG